MRCDENHRRRNHEVTQLEMGGGRRCDRRAVERHARPVQAPPRCGPAEARASGAGGQRSVDIPVVTLKVTEAGLDAPSEIPSGVVAVKVEGGDPENRPELARLNEGVTMAQLTEALSQPDPMAALPLVSLLGSAASVNGQVIYDLHAGRLCGRALCPGWTRRWPRRSSRVNPAAQRRLRRTSASHFGGLQLRDAGQNRNWAAGLADRECRRISGTMTHCQAQ